MTDTTYPATGQGDLPFFCVRETRDRRAIDAALSEDRAYAAYALGHLESGLFEHARFWLAEGDPGSAVVMHATAMGRTMFVGGDPAALDAILSLHPGPRTSYLSTCAAQHRPVLERTFALSDPLPMIRMSVTQSAFTPISGPLRRLGGDDVRTLNRLYAIEAGTGYYSAEHVENGIYYGAFDGDHVVSVAGTHIVAPHVSIAVVGNVFTHPAYRGRGLAEQVTSGVTAELLGRGCALVALTVDPANAPAVHAYTRLGYEPGTAVVEARARRRDPLGLGSWLRRRVARRAAAPGDELARGRPLDGEITGDDREAER